MKKLNLLYVIAALTLFGLASCEKTGPESRNFSQPDAQTLINSENQDGSSLETEIIQAGYDQNWILSDDDTKYYEKSTISNNGSTIETIEMDLNDFGTVEDMIYTKTCTTEGCMGLSYIKEQIRTICNQNNGSLDNGCYIIVGSPLTGDRTTTFSSPTDFYKKASDALDANYSGDTNISIELELEVPGDSDYSLYFNKTVVTIGNTRTVSEAITIEADLL